MFLTDLDYKNHQRVGDLRILTNGDNINVRNFAEAAAQEEMISFLGLRFDTDLIFIDVLTWNNTSTYTVGDHVLKDDLIYNAISDHAGTDPATSNTDWALGDLRNQLVVMRMIDIAIYHMYAKIPNRQTPEDVVYRYEETISWLKNVAKGLYSPKLPLLENDTTENKILFGNNEKINWR